MGDSETGLDPMECKAFIEAHKESIEKFSKMSPEEFVRYFEEKKAKRNKDLQQAKLEKQAGNISNTEEQSPRDG